MINNCMKRLLLLAFSYAALVQAVYAQDGFLPPEDQTLSTKQFVLDVGGGVIVKPRYPGSDSYLAYPLPLISVGPFFIVPGLGQVVDGQNVKRGFNIYPSFDFIGEREASDSTDLIGTNKVDWALELGLGIGYRYDWVRGFVALRQGFNGHEGQVVDLGIDIITNPMDRLEFRFGPRATWASNDYMDTYFGVTMAEAGPSLSAFDADSGFATIGISARASYAWSEITTLHLQGNWDRFVGDAEKSPIVKAGSEDQYSIGVGVTYRVAFDIFK